MAEMKEDQRLQDKRLQANLAILRKELSIHREGLQNIIEMQLAMSNVLTALVNNLAAWRLKTDNTLTALTTKVNQLQTRVEDIARKVGA